MVLERTWVAGLLVVALLLAVEVRGAEAVLVVIAGARVLGPYEEFPSGAVRKMKRLATVCLVLATSCSIGGGGDDADDKAAPLEPKFPPAEAGSKTTAGGPSTTAAAGTPGASPSTAPSSQGGQQAPPPLEPGATQGSLTDAVGDVTPTPLDPAPDWADLVGARIIRRNDGVEVRVRLNDTAPATAPDDAHTMNIASFYDIDGDGSINFEVWLNISSSGWGGSWFDNDTEQAKFQDDAQLAITVEGNDVAFSGSDVPDSETSKPENAAS